MLSYQNWWVQMGISQNWWVQLHPLTHPKEGTDCRVIWSYFSHKSLKCDGMTNDENNTQNMDGTKDISDYVYSILDEVEIRSVGNSTFAMKRK